MAKTNVVSDMVADRVADCVSTAIQFGVSADDFLRLVRNAWKAELSEKARSDDAVFRRAVTREGDEE